LFGTGRNKPVVQNQCMIRGIFGNQRLLSLDISLKETPSRWWGVHKETIQDWYQCKQLMHIRFDVEQGSTTVKNYDGRGALVEHLEK
jgi:hypothetical protein